MGKLHVVRDYRLITSTKRSRLLVDPLVRRALVVDRSALLAEPQGNLLLGRLNRVRAVADVAADIDSAA